MYAKILYKSLALLYTSADDIITSYNCIKIYEILHLLIYVHIP